MVQQDLPVIVDSRCLEVTPPVLYLGGGKVDVKLKIPVRDLVSSLKATIGLISDPR